MKSYAVERSDQPHPDHPELWYVFDTMFRRYPRIHSRGELLVRYRLSPAAHAQLFDEMGPLNWSDTVEGVPLVRDASVEWITVDYAPTVDVMTAYLRTVEVPA